MKVVCSRRSTRSLSHFFQFITLRKIPRNTVLHNSTFPTPQHASSLVQATTVISLYIYFQKTTIHLKYFEVSLIESVSRSTNFKSSSAINSRLDSKCREGCSSIFPFSSSTENWDVMYVPCGTG